MFLWLCYLFNEEWVAYVIAPSRGKAKKMFFDHFNDGMIFYTDVRARKVKPADGFSPKVCDMQCEDLDALGVHYINDEEQFDEMWEVDDED